MILILAIRRLNLFGYDMYYILGMMMARGPPPRPGMGGPPPRPGMGGMPPRQGPPPGMMPRVSVSINHSYILCVGGLHTFELMLV